MNRSKENKPRVFYPSGHIPGSIIIAEAPLFAIILIALSSRLLPVLRGPSVCFGLLLLWLFLRWQYRAGTYPRLQLDKTELTYRDHQRGKTIPLEEIAGISGGAVLTLTLSDGSVVKFSSFAASQFEMARGTNTYPDRLSHELASLIGEDRAEGPAPIDEPVPREQRRTALFALLSMSLIWLIIIVKELLRS